MRNNFIYVVFGIIICIIAVQVLYNPTNVEYIETYSDMEIDSSNWTYSGIKDYFITDYEGYMNFRRNYDVYGGEDFGIKGKYYMIILVSDFGKNYHTYNIVEKQHNVTVYDSYTYGILGTEKTFLVIELSDNDYLLTYIDNEIITSDD